MKTFLVILLVQAILTDQTFHDTNYVSEPMKITERVGEMHELQLPFRFQRVWSIDIPNAISQNPTIASRSICRVRQPQVNLQQLDYYQFDEWKYFKDVIVKYEDLQKRQDILDMIIVYDMVAICMASGKLRVLQIKPADPTTGASEHLEMLYDMTFEGVTAEQPLKEGYFVEMPSAILFINEDFAFTLNGSTLKKLTGYTPNPNFQSVEYSNEHHVVIVAEGETGLRLYRYNDTQGALQEVYLFNKTSFGAERVDITDVVTHKNLLYVLDRYGGIYKVELNSQNLAATVINKTKFTLGDCQNLAINGRSLYVTCPQVHEVRLESWVDKKYPDELFQVRNLAVSPSGIVIVSGQNLLKLYIQGNLVGFYQQFRIDRLRVTDDKLFIATETGVSYVDWSLFAANISCGLKQAGNQNVQGNMSTTIKVIAECSEKFYLDHSLPYKDDLKEKMCAYHFPLIIRFWQGRHINWSLFKWAGIGFVVLLVIVFIGWIVIKRQLKMVNAAILKYSSLKPSDAPEVPYNNMAEEKEEAIENVEMKEIDKNKTESLHGLKEKARESHHQIGD